MNLTRLTDDTMHFVPAALVIQTNVSSCKSGAGAQVIGNGVVDPTQERSVVDESIMQHIRGKSGEKDLEVYLQFDYEGIWGSLFRVRQRERPVVVGGLPRICLIGRDVLRLCSVKFGSNGEASLVFPHKDFGAFDCT
ncbi:hypothetical protein WMF27_32105 [Sorangium sp. So ce281]|uniref:hypothetical protein n=1 Tax=unclassified Sorangium TaxID=2621164 RepID=UPI003F63ABD3